MIAWWLLPSVTIVLSRYLRNFTNFQISSELILKLILYHLKRTINSTAHLSALLIGFKTFVSSAQQILTCVRCRVPKKTVSGGDSAFRYAWSMFLNTDIITSISNSNFHNWLSFNMQAFVKQLYLTLSGPQIFLYRFTIVRNINIYNNNNNNSYLRAVMSLLVHSTAVK